jgi:hypothetical protein
MAATLMQLRRLVRSRLGVPMTDDFFTDDVLDDSINLAIDTIETEFRWPWQERIETVTVTPAEPDVAMPVGWRATHGLFNGEEELACISALDILSWSDTPGAPTVWAPVGDSLLVRPLVQTSTELTHFYQRDPVWLREDTDTPDMPAQFSGAIVAKAAELLSNREDNRAAAGVHLTDYTQWIVRMRRELRRSTGPIRVRVRPGGWV